MPNPIIASPKMPGEEYLVALGHIPIEEEGATPPPPAHQNGYGKKKGLWSGIKNMFHQRQRTPSRLDLSQL